MSADGFAPEPHVSVTQLDNGLTVATDHMSGVESAALGIWTRCGTRHETPQVNGVAHMLEHMLFKGTTSRSARDIAEQIEAVGGQLNAYTSRETTAYHARVLRADVPLAIDIIGDLLQRSVFDETELARERQVVIQEIGQSRDTPDDIVFDHFQTVAYPGQSIGRPILGTEETVGGLSREALVGYLESHYRPENLVLAAAGAVDHAELVDLAAKAFDALAPGPTPPEERAVYHGGEYRAEEDLEQVHLVLGFPGVSFHDPDYYAAAVCCTLAGGGMSSRLFQEIREKRGLVYSIYTFTSAYEDGGLFGVYAGTGPEEVVELIPVLADEIAKLPDSLTEEEVARARAQLRASLLMGLESSMTRAEQLAQQMLIYRRPMSTAEMMAKVEAVDLASVARVARGFKGVMPTLAALGPIGRLEPFDRLRARLA